VPPGGPGRIQSLINPLDALGVGNLYNASCVSRAIRISGNHVDCWEEEKREGAERENGDSDYGCDFSFFVQANIRVANAQASSLHRALS
jgi:hypothetical protein